jgi:hypothetical protein
VKRHNIAVADRRESYQTEVQQFTLTVRNRGVVVEDRPRIEDVNGAVESELLHSKQKVNADRSIEMRIGDRAGILEVGKEAENRESEKYRQQAPFHPD